MSSAILNITFDCADPRALARFWGEVTGWPVIEEPQPGSAESAVGNPGEGRPRLYFVRVPEDKTIKNRVHLDVMPDDRTPANWKAPRGPPRRPRTLLARYDLLARAAAARASSAGQPSWASFPL